MSSQFGNCSYEYLVELKEDYEQKLRIPAWHFVHDILKDDLHAIEYRLHLLKEQELCMKFQEERISQSISQSLN